MKKRVLVISCIVFILIIVVVGFIAFRYRDNHTKITYADHLDDVALTVDGEPVSLRQMSFYIAYEELEVEKQAVIYSPDHTNDYWQLHINGEFIKVTAKQAAFDMGVHDKILYELAAQDGITLSAEEEQTTKKTAQDFWDDLTEEQQQRIAVSEDEIYDAMSMIAVAQKYQSYLSDKNGFDYDKYEFDGDAYKAILGEHEVVANEKIWGLLDFGNIVLNHE